MVDQRLCSSVWHDLQSAPATCGSEVAVGGTRVAVGGIGVAEGGTGVAEGGTGVSVLGGGGTVGVAGTAVGAAVGVGAQLANSTINAIPNTMVKPLLIIAVSSGN